MNYAFMDYLRKESIADFPDDLGAVKAIRLRHNRLMIECENGIHTRTLKQDLLFMGYIPGH